MFRSLLALSAVALAVPAAAATYSAKPSTPTAQRYIARDITWTCAGGICQGSTEESRPAVLCQSLAKRAGRIDSFAVDGRAFTGAELDRCNSAAKQQPAKALAAP